jgi:hypothetical protein
VAAVLLAVVAAACAPATPTPATSPGGPSASPVPAPSGWTYLPWYDPDLELAVPAGWEPTITFQQYSPDPSSSPDVLAGAAWWNAKVAGGAMRMQASQYSSGDGSSLTLLVMVEHGDASLEAFVTRSVAEASYVKETDRHEAQFAIGRAIVVDYASQASSFTSVARDYFFRLADGRSLLVEVASTGSVGASPAPDAVALAAVGDQIVATLRPHQ